MNKFAAKVCDKTREVVNHINQAMVEKSVMTKSGISNGTYVGKMEDLTLERFVRSLQNFRKYGMLKTCMVTLSYTPAHKMLDFKLPHHYDLYMAYSKKADETFIFVANDGLLALSSVFGNKHQKGTLLKFRGLVTGEDFLHGERYQKRADDLFAYMYEVKEAEIRESVERDKEAV